MKNIKLKALALIIVFAALLSSLSLTGRACERSIGDINHDGIINIEDATILAMAWQSKLGDANFNPDCDLNNDGIINIIDATYIGYYWTQSLEVKVFIMPHTLNLKSRGNWITCIILLPDCAKAADVETSSIKLNGTIAASKVRICDCVNAVIVKFSRSAVKTLIHESHDSMASLCCRKLRPITLTVSGKLSDGLEFSGSDEILVIHR